MGRPTHPRPGEGRSLGEVGEHVFLEDLCRRLRGRPGGAGEDARVLVGPGDDCAVLAPSPHPLALTTDALVEGVHFRSEWLRPEELGRRAAAVSFSDLAAMAATPVALLLAAGVPPGFPSETLRAVLDGCAGACDEAGAALVGGNLTRSDGLALTSTAVGEIRGRRLERSGARPGDLLVVSGTLGDAALAVRCWRAGREPPPEARQRWVAPSPRGDVAALLAAAGARAAIDLSDGLLADLGHLCRASGVGATIERDRLPRSAAVAAADAAGGDLALAGGEDYELLFACPAEIAPEIAALSRQCGVPLTPIGCCTADEALVVREPDGRPHVLPVGGFDHFAEEPARSPR